MESAGHASTLLRDGFILLAAALAFVLLFRRLGLGATLGFLTAGAVVGPQVFGLVGDAESKLGIGELGITLLLFVVGLELNPARLWKLRHEIFGVGLLQVVICGLAITGMLLAFTSFTPQAALALGLPLALSSTAQVLPMLRSAGRMRTPFGERSFAILLFQDLSIIPLITIVAAMSRNPADSAGPPGWLLAVYTIIAVAGLIAAGRFIIRPLFRLIGVLGERELFVFAGLFTVIASAAVMENFGLSTALGAFIAGAMLADSPYRHELEADVEPFRSILLGLFFVTVGMMLDLGAIMERPLYIFSMAVGVIAVKALVIFVIGLLFRMDWRNALALGLLLSQGGEFGFVLFAKATDAFLISPEAANIFGAVVTLSMVATPFLMMATRKFREPPAKKSSEERDGPQADGANAIVVGYGRFGQTVAQVLLSSDVPVTLIDNDAGMIDAASQFGAKVYFGDGRRVDILRLAGAEDAEAIMFCSKTEEITPDVLEAIHNAFPRAELYVRAYDRRALIRLTNAPATPVREVYESAIKMARMALDGMGVGLEQSDRAESLYRQRDRERLGKQIEANDIRAGRDHIITERQGGPLPIETGDPRDLA